MTFTEEDIYNLTRILKHYHDTRYRQLANYKKIIENRTTITINNKQCYQYNCPCQTIYLDENDYPVTYQKQHILLDEDTQELGYYYDFNNDKNEAGTYTYINKYEYKRNSIWED